MRTFIWTITALVAATLVLALPSSCQSAAEEQPQDSLAAAEAGAQAAAGQAQQQAQEALKQADAISYNLSLPTSSPSQLLGLSQQTAQSILVIPLDEIKAEDLAAITEDIGIMCRVLDKKLEQDLRNAMVARFPFGGNIGPEGIYLEGYGALFLLNVNFPLIPPPETKREEQPKQESDAFWEETKRELYSTKEGGGFTGGGYGSGGAMIYAYGLDRSGEEYDPEKVEGLKTTLIRCLKHAANIRNLKPDESVIITAKGCAPAAVIEETVIEHSDRRSSTTTRLGSRGTAAKAPVRKPLTPTDGYMSPAVLTIRAKKSDIDAFSKGELNFDQFCQKVRIHTYQTSGRNMIRSQAEDDQRF
jgi:hypothetical protein